MQNAAPALKRVARNAVRELLARARCAMHMAEPRRSLLAQHSAAQHPAEPSRVGIGSGPGGRTGRVETQNRQPITAHYELVPPSPPPPLFSGCAPAFSRGKFSHSLPPLSLSVPYPPLPLSLHLLPSPWHRVLTTGPCSSAWPARLRGGLHPFTPTLGWALGS